MDITYTLGTQCKLFPCLEKNLDFFEPVISVIILILVMHLGSECVLNLLNTTFFRTFQNYEA